MAMGFSSTEARLALRASFNDVDKAVEQIFKVSPFSLVAHSGLGLQARLFAEETGATRGEEGREGEETL